MVLRPCKSPAIVGEIATRIIEAIEQPIVVGNSEIHVSTSIGVTSSLSNGDTKEALPRCADVALYEAKAAGRRTFRAFEPDMDKELRRRRQLEVGLRQAIEAGDLDLHYQPQVDLASGRIFGVETLVRWTDPVHGTIAPDVLIEIASQCGMIIDLGSWVIETACRRTVSWAEKRADLQIAEDAMIRDNEATLDMLNSLRQRGITLAIDDFGTGHSNLGYLKRLPIQYLKIDRAFIKYIETDSSDRAIIQGIIGLARSLELEAIAEGVETEEQRDFLVAAGCRGAQGFLFEAALPETELLSLLDDSSAQQPSFRSMAIAARSTVH